MSDYDITRDPFQFVAELIQLGLCLLVLVIVVTACRSAWDALDQWLWKRRRKRWAKERGE
jgi:hypothetical protein